MGREADQGRRRLRHLALPLLAIIFLPLATLIYALLDTPGRGLTGGDWIWVTVAALLGMEHWAAGATQRNRLPGRRPSAA